MSETVGPPDAYGSAAVSGYPHARYPHAADSVPEDRVILADRPVRPVNQEREAAFSAFYRSNVRLIIRDLIFMGANPQDAAECAQEAMLVAYSRWLTIESPSAYVRTVATRLWIKRETSVKDRTYGDLPESVLLVSASSSDIDEWVRKHRVLQLLEGLPIRQRQVMAWTLAQHTPQEIAERLGIKPEAVRSSLLKARQALAARRREFKDGDSDEG